MSLYIASPGVTQQKSYAIRINFTKVSHLSFISFKFPITFVDITLYFPKKQRKVVMTTPDHHGKKCVWFMKALQIQIYVAFGAFLKNRPA